MVRVRFTVRVRVRVQVRVRVRARVRVRVRVMVRVRVRRLSPVTLKSVGAILGKSGRYLLVTSLRLRRRFGEKKLPQKVSSLFAAGTTSGR